MERGAPPRKRLGGSSLARIAGNILSGIAARHPLSSDDVGEAWYYATDIAKRADAYDAMLAEEAKNAPK